MTSPNYWFHKNEVIWSIVQRFMDKVSISQTTSATFHTIVFPKWPVWYLNSEMWAEKGYYFMSNLNRLKEIRIQATARQLYCRQQQMNELAAWWSALRYWLQRPRHDELPPEHPVLHQPLHLCWVLESGIPPQHVDVWGLRASTPANTIIHGTGVKVLKIVACK